MSDNGSRKERDLFLEALAIPEGDSRFEFLKKACRGDVAMEERIFRLLKAETKGGAHDFLESGLEKERFRGTDSVFEQKEGSTFGDYELLKHVASGAMGIVWRARQKSLDREVALKMLRQSWIAGDEEWERFRTEAQVTAGLRHPHIVPVYEFGEEEGQPYLTMPFIEGETLSEKFPELQANQRASISLFVKIVDAVDAAHRRGILHRDLKPGNILIDREGEPHVSDFGIAKRQLSDSNLTLSGQVMGTPYYMAPEQARGETGNSTPAMDIFSLGVILYELLSGARPFQGESAVSLMKQVIEEKEVRLRMRDRSIDGDLEAIVEKCLEKEAGNRYQTAGALSEDLRFWLEGKPVSVKPATPRQRLVKWALRKPIHACLAAVSLLFILTLAIGGPLVAVRQAELNRELALRSETLARNSYRSGLAAAVEALEQPAPTERVLEIAEQMRPLEGESDHLGWEWGFLRASVSQSEKVFPVETFRFSHIVVDSSGKRLAIPSPKSVVVLDMETGEVGGSFPVEEGMLPTALGWDTETERMVLSARDGTVRMYSGPREEWKWARDGSEGQRSGELVLSWNREGKKIAIGTPQGEIVILDSDSGEKLESWKAHLKLLAGLEWAPGGAKLLSFSNDKEIRIWETTKEGGRAFRALDAGEKVFSAGWSPDGKMIGMAGGSGLFVYDSDTGSLLCKKGGVYGERALAWHPNSKFFVSAGLDETIRLWDLEDESSEPVRTFSGHTGEILSLLWSADPSRIYSLSLDNTLRVWNPQNPGARFSLQKKGGVFALSWNPAGDRLAVSGQSKEIDVILRGSRRIAKRFESPVGLVRHLAWSPDGKTLASCQKDNTIRLWSVGKGTGTEVRGPFPVPRRGISWSPGRYLLHWGGTGISRAGGILKLQGLEGSGVFRLVRVSPDGEVIAAVRATENDIVLLDPTTGIALGQIVPDREALSDFAWSPDGGHLVVADLAGNVSIWDAETKERVRILSGHTGPVRSVAWHPAEDRIASGGDDRTVRLWNPENGDELLVLREHQAIVRDVAWDPKGEFLVSGDEAGVIWSRNAERR